MTDYFDNDEMDRIADSINSADPDDLADFQRIVEEQFGGKNEKLTRKQRQTILPEIREGYEERYGELREPRERNKRLLQAKGIKYQKTYTGQVRGKNLRVRAVYITIKGKRRQAYRDFKGRFAKRR